MSFPLSNAPHPQAADLHTAALHLVHHTHGQIEQWIGGVAPPDQALTTLLSSFAPDFAMVTTTGERLAADKLPALFAGLRGTRPGLTIQIDELTVHHADACAVLLGYRERHRWDDGSTSRRATALFTVNADGQPQWAHLHETWA